MRWCVVKAIDLYRYIFSYWLHWMWGPTAGCRFYPTCSDYAKAAVADLGVLRGLFMAGRRVLRCHPWAVGGYDPFVIRPVDLRGNDQ